MLICQYIYHQLPFLVSVVKEGPLFPKGHKLQEFTSITNKWTLQFVLAIQQKCFDRDCIVSSIALHHIMAIGLFHEDFHLNFCYYQVELGGYSMNEMSEFYE